MYDDEALDSSGDTKETEESDVEDDKENLTTEEDDLNEKLAELDVTEK